MTRAKVTHTSAKADVVLLHGLGGSRHDWDSVLSHLSGKVDALALDLPGGAETPPAKAYDPASLAVWLSGALDAAGLKRVRLVGHSIGGRIAGELAATEPGRVVALALVAPLGAAGYGLADKLKWKAMSRQAILRSVPERQMRRALSVGFCGDDDARKGFIDRALAARTGPRAADVTRAIEKSVDGVLAAPPLSERLRGTRTPLLVVSGSEDPLVPPDQTAALLSARPDATAVRLHGQGHYPMLEDPKSLARTLLEFLSPR